MTKTFPIDANNTTYTNLHRLQNDTDARKSLLAFLISNNSNHSEAFLDYEQQYIALFEEYNNVKGQFEEEIIRPIAEEEHLSVYSWFVNFNNGTVTLQW